VIDDSTRQIARPRAPETMRGLQQGVSMIFALLTLAALALASLALVRSVDSGALVIGNIGFKQDATAFSDRASEDAIAFLSGTLSGATLHTDLASAGYYATAHTTLDPLNSNPSVTTRAVVDWDGDDCAAYASGTFTGGCLKPRSAASDAATGKATQYVIMRLCSAQLSATDASNVCSGPLTTSTSTSPTRGSVDYTSGRFAAPVLLPYFRIIVRSTGARNTASVTETIVHF
jgi:type IV pilus assembly protein PilX